MRTVKFGARLFASQRRSPVPSTRTTLPTRPSGVEEETAREEHAMSMRESTFLDWASARGLTCPKLILAAPDGRRGVFAR
jgi:hypothetical protein